MSDKELVSIDNCTSVQVLSSQDVPLAAGTLALYSVPEQQPTEGAPAPHSSDSTTAILTLKIGNAAFPITKSTAFYTHVESPRIYIFSPILDDAAIGAGTYVKITLPEEISVEGSEAEKARDAFEEILVQHGLLQEGPAAVADELSTGAREAGKTVAASVGGLAERHVSGPPNAASTFPSAVHSAADSAVSGTATLQSYTSSASQTMASVGTSIGASASTMFSKAGETVARAGVAVGERLVHLLGVEDQVERVSSQDGGSKFDNAGTSTAFEATEEDEEAKYGDGTGAVAKQVGEAIATVGSGVRDGAATAVGATRDAATSVLQHDVGSEAVELVTKSGEAVDNVGKASGDVLLATSAVATAGYIAGGVKDGPEVPDKDGPEVPDKDVQVREDFKISTSDH